MNSSLVENTDRVFIEDSKAKQQQQALIAAQQEEQQFWPINWTKLGLLIIFTFGLIALMWFICTKIETMKGNVLSSYKAGGGLLFGLFCFYVIAFGAAWIYGSRQRQRIKREVVEKQLERQRAMQALIFDE